MDFKYNSPKGTYASHLDAAHKKAITLLKSWISQYNTKPLSINGNTAVETPGALMSTPIISSIPINVQTIAGSTNTQKTKVVVRFYYYLGAQSTNGSEISLKHFSNNGSNLTNSTSIEIHSQNALGQALSILYPKNVDVQLQMVRQYMPYLNASILAQYLAINASKYGFHRMITILLNAVPYASTEESTMLSPSSVVSDNNIPIISACTCGIKVTLSGLLSTQRNSARKTVYTAYAGTFHGTNTTVDYADSTSTSRVGAFHVKVWLCSTTV